MIKLFHHPYSRAANTIWMLEEVGAPYELEFVDIMHGDHKRSSKLIAANAMGKIPTLVDGDVVVTESAAIGLYLADRYGYGRLAPKVDEPARGTYLRWSLFAPSVIEPGSVAKQQGWVGKEGAVGWGNHDAMLTAMEGAIAKGPWLLGDTFTMADVIFGGTIAYMLQFGMLEKRAVFTGYAERIAERPAYVRSTEKNRSIAKEHGLG